MLRIQWAAHVSKEDVFVKMETKRTLINRIENRQLEYERDIMSKESQKRYTHRKREAAEHLPYVDGWREGGMVKRKRIIEIYKKYEELSSPRS